MPLREAIARINVAGTQLALVVDEETRLLGTLSDGDIRNALLAGLDLNQPVENCMHLNPTTVTKGESRDEIIARMRKQVLHQIPVLDAEGRVVDLKTIDQYLLAPHQENWVVIMAGGLGSRMKELTKNTPKPMLPVGDTPLLETIVRRLVEQGFQKIWLAVNYHADQIENHFGNGAKFGAEIHYLREDQRMGTAGALSLLQEQPQAPLLVTNADLLATIDYAELIEAHTQAVATATMAVREYEYQIPFGVVNGENGQLISLEEKPILQTLVNAGIYVLSPEALTRVPKQTFFDMTELFAAMVTEGLPVRYHRIHGYWLDIGKHEDYHRANGDFETIFQ